MKYCSACGKQIGENAAFCPYCGCAVGVVEKNNDEYARLISFARNASAINIISILGFIFMILSIIAALVPIFKADLIVLPLAIISDLVCRSLLKKYEDIDKNGEKYYLATQLKPTNYSDLLMYETAIKRMDRGIRLGNAMRLFLLIFIVTFIVVFVISVVIFN